MRAGVYACVRVLRARPQMCGPAMFCLRNCACVLCHVDVRCVGVRGVRVRKSHMIYSVLLLLETLPEILL